MVVDEIADCVADYFQTAFCDFACFIVDPYGLVVNGFYGNGVSVLHLNQFLSLS
ncbi:MAG: hypothetical protein IKB70_08365 [Bacilli bacterium]|nr:hypothetical protein [Bacilli bacterium]